MRCARIEPDDRVYGFGLLWWWTLQRHPGLPVWEEPDVTLLKHRNDVLVRAGLWEARLA
jgi:hypothetical protein